MDQPTFREDGDGTRRRLEPSPPAKVFEEDDLSDQPESTPLWAAGQRCYMCIVLAILLSALTDYTISTYLVPTWGWPIFEWAVLLVPVGAVIYKLCERLIAYEPPPCMR
ncbi:hypothetical protein MTO96_038973 [Rhipicephalus appendiculatus]